MMTIDEVLQKKIARVRLPQWFNKSAYLRFDYLNGGHGPWAHLYERTTQELINEPTPQSFLIYMLVKDENGYEEYTGDIDKDDHAPTASAREQGHEPR